MRLPGDIPAPWERYLPPDASPAARALAKQLWESGARPSVNGVWVAPPTPGYGPTGHTAAVPTSPAYPGTGGRPVQDPGDEPLPGPGGSMTQPGAPTPDATPPPPPAPVAPDPANDPAYQALLAALTRQRHDAIVSYGDPSGTGADSDTAAQAAANPYSTTHLLAQGLTHNLGGINTAANAHGALYSGANVQGQQNEYTAGAQRSYAARKALLDQLNSLTDQQNTGYWDAYHRLAGSV
jgi:hypothetical protein